MDDEQTQLTIEIIAPTGASSLERDGMLWRLDDVVTDAVSQYVTQGYLVQGSAEPGRVRLVLVAADLSAPEVLGAVGDAVTDLLTEADLAGWGPFSLTTTEDPDDLVDLDDLDALDDLGFEDPADEDDEDDEDGPEGADNGPEPELGPGDRLSRDAQWVRGLDQSWLTELDVESADPDERARALVESEYVAGALFQASVQVVDHLFEDLDTLMQAGDGETVADVEGAVFPGLEGLPERFADRYDATFTRRLVVAVADVTRRFTSGWEPLACVAQELGLRLLLDQAEVQLELAEVSVGPGWRALSEEYLFEDPDHEMLYEPALEGIEGALLAGLASAPMEFEAWFLPFNTERTLPPFLLDQGDAADPAPAAGPDPRSDRPTE